MPTPGQLWRQAVAQHAPLPIVGAINAYHALLAEHSGHQALYVSGGGVAASSCGLPDLGITTLEDVLIDVRRITARTPLPVLVDIDTGWGSAFNIARTIFEMERAGAAAVHLEDQVSTKRCGHRPGKAVVSCAEMVDRIKAAVDARRDSNFVIMARTDAFAPEGLNATLDRIAAYIEAGADMIFPEAMPTLDLYQTITQACRVPVLANITEFGQTPLFSRKELHQAGIQMVLYPLTAFRAASQAALGVYQHLAHTDQQRELLPILQSRSDLYQHLNYHQYEEKLDALFAKGAE